MATLVDTNKTTQISNVENFEYEFVFTTPCNVNKDEDPGIFFTAANEVLGILSDMQRAPTYFNTNQTFVDTYKKIILFKSEFSDEYYEKIEVWIEDSDVSESGMFQYVVGFHTSEIQIEDVATLVDMLDFLYNKILQEMDAEIGHVKLDEVRISEIKKVSDTKFYIVS